MNSVYKMSPKMQKSLNFTSKSQERSKFKRRIEQNKMKIMMKKKLTMNS